MIIYLITILFSFFNYITLNDNTFNITFLSEYDIAQNYNSYIKEGTYISLIMKVEESYDLNNLCIKLKIFQNSSLTIDIYVYGYSDYPKSIKEPIFQKNIDNYCQKFGEKEYTIYRYIVPDFKKDNLKYIKFYLKLNSREEFFSFLVYPFKIFNILNSNEYQINLQYSNGIIPAFSNFFLKAKNENIGNVYIKFIVLHNTNINFNIRAGDFRSYLTDEKAKAQNNFGLNITLLEKSYFKEYDNYIYHVLLLSEIKKYVLFSVELTNPLNYLSVILYNETSNEEGNKKEKSESSDKSSNEKSLPEESAYKGSSISPAIIAIIILLSCIILIGIIYFFIRKYFLRKNSINLEYAPGKNIEPKDLEYIQPNIGLYEKNKD